MYQSAFHKIKQIVILNSLILLCCSLLELRFTYRAEVCGNNYNVPITPIIVLEKRAVQVVKMVVYAKHTLSWFLSKLLKRIDFVQYNTN